MIHLTRPVAAAAAAAGAATASDKPTHTRQCLCVPAGNVNKLEGAFAVKMTCRQPARSLASAQREAEKSASIMEPSADRDTLA